ncbi:MBG domain-containing protein [Chishuiella sp.]|uniref:MBG domain-containing protein n=1 Tax=Chishuiella sp. TaxID=1969467 RepID=UPI0028A60409|nr:MBG domain-containing protein [Chishuiella sp.]
MRKMYLFFYFLFFATLLNARTIDRNKILISSTYNPKVVFTPSSDNILYVKKDGSGKQDGSSWDNAIGELADALKWANDENKKNAWSDSNPLKIYVSKGTYHPLYSPEDGENYGKDDGRNNTFLMVNNVKLYGGFDPDNNIKTLDDKRIIPDGKNEAPNGTILSGDFNDDDIISGSGKILEIKNNTENAYHVVTGINKNSIFLFLDGFTIKMGNANQNSEIKINGQGVHRDRGAGIYFRSSDSSAILNLNNVDVSCNTTTTNGGGVYNESSNNSSSEVNIKQSLISNNIGRFGAGIHSYSYDLESKINIYNSTIKSNNSSDNGGGIYSYSNNSLQSISNVNIYNSILSKNYAPNGGGIYSSSQSNKSFVKIVNSSVVDNSSNLIISSQNLFTFYNSIFYKNKDINDKLITTVSNLYNNYNKEIKYSYIQGITSTDNGNIDGTLDPLFTNESSGDYSLQQNSPLVNKGNNALYTGDINTDTDLANNPRLFDGTIDIGAYESQPYQAPKIINVTSTTDNGLYGIGRNIPITVEFDKIVNVDTINGIPKLLLETGLVDRSAEYISGTGTNTLTFIYNIQQGDLSENLEYNSTFSLSLNGSKIKSSSLIDAVLLLPEPKEKGSLSTNKNIVIDGIRPVVNSIIRLNDSPTKATSVSFEVTFSEPVSSVDISDFTLTTIGSASGNIASITTVDDKYTVVVNSISGQGEIRLDLKPSGTGIMDVAENLIANGFNSGETYEIDLVAPAIPTDFVGVGGNEEINLSWNANIEDDFKQYNLFVLIEGTKTFLATIPSGTETYKHTGLNNNTSYTYYISAEDNLGNKSSEATTSATTLANQIITFNPLQNIIYGDEIELSAISSSGLEVEFQSSNNSIAEVYKDNNGKWKLKAKAIGNVTITAIQSGDNTYLPAANVSQILTINPAIITITAEPKSKNYAEIDPELTYTVSGLVNNDIQSDILSGSLQREIGEDVGTYEIQKGTLSATSNYSLVYVNNYLEISKATISGISFSDNSFEYDGSSKSLSIIGTLPTGATVSYTNNNQTNAGTYLVTANIDGGVNYEGFILTANLEIMKVYQTITWNQNLVVGCSGETSIDLEAKSSSGLPITYKSSDESIVQIIGNKAIMIRGGMVKITAILKGDENYYDAEEVEITMRNLLNGYIKQKWNDVLIFDNLSNQYVKWQWYKDGKKIFGATKQFYNSSSALSGEYYVTATDIDGNEIDTCPISIAVARQINKGGIKIAPNPIRQGELFKLYADYSSEDLVGASIVVVDLLGKQINKITKIDLETTIPAPLIGGVYIVYLSLKNGKKSSTKLLVK